MNKFVSIIPVTDSGKIALQERDNKENILNPGKITLFGGHVDKNEEFITAAVRELKEELTIEVKRKQLEYLGTYPVHKTEGNGICVVFIVRNVPTESLILKEGSKIYFLKNEDELINVKLTKVTKKTLNDYFHLR